MTAIRHYRSSDLPALAQVYDSAIRHIGPSHYSADQVDAWAGYADDAMIFREWIESAETLVATDTEDRCIGFGGLTGGDHVASLFVAPDHQRQGVASALLSQLMAMADPGPLSAKASEFSRPLFERFGFVVTAVEHTRLKGVAFTRYAMRADRATSGRRA